jgi:hypothetical protein
VLKIYPLVYSCIRKLGLTLAAALCIASANGVTLDSEPHIWRPNRSQSNVYDVDPVSAANHATVFVSGNTPHFAPANTGPQTAAFRVFGVSFSRVPAVNPSIAAAVSSLLAAFVIRRHNARFRK